MHTPAWGSAAAILLLSLGGLLWFTQHSSPEQASFRDSSAVRETPSATPVLLDRMLVADGITTENHVTASDGTLVKQIKRRVQTHERYRDSTKGYLITVSESRDEQVNMPQKGF